MFLYHLEIHIHVYLFSSTNWLMSSTHVARDNNLYKTIDLYILYCNQPHHVLAIFDLAILNLKLYIYMQHLFENRSVLTLRVC